MKSRHYSPVHERQWNEGLAQLDAFLRFHGHARIPVKWTAPNGHRTGQWLVRIRAQERAGQLGQARLQQMRERGVNPHRSQDIFDEWLSILDEYAALNFDTNVPLHYADSRGNKLGHWLSRQRRQMRAGVLEKERQQQLLERGVDFDPHDTAFKNALAELDMWGQSSVPQHTITNTGFHLGMWASAQRHRYRLGMLNLERVKELEKRGFIWDVREESFRSGLQELDGHLRLCNYQMPRNDAVTSSGFPLGNWLHTRQAQHKKGSLPIEHLQELREREIGWALR